MAKIYVATSWRNTFQELVVKQLRADGHTVYDFKEDKGFRWSEIDPDWVNWNPTSYIAGLSHPRAKEGFSRDMTALDGSEICVYVMPCGPSASLEAGWAKGAGRRVVVYIPQLREPDLMVKMADLITTDLQDVRDYCLVYPDNRVG